FGIRQGRDERVAGHPVGPLGRDHGPVRLRATGRNTMKGPVMERRRFLAAGAAGLAARALTAPAVAQPAKTATLRFVPQANLTLLDPILTTALVTTNPAYYVSDVLYSMP